MSAERCGVHVEKDRAKDRALAYATGKGGDEKPEARTEKERDVK